MSHLSKKYNLRCPFRLKEQTANRSEYRTMPDVSMDILLNEPVAAIHPHLYGHFMEHLGGCIEEGCWVGEDSIITHTGGIRDDVVSALKAVGAPVIRWP